MKQVNCFLSSNAFTLVNIFITLSTTSVEGQGEKVHLTVRWQPALYPSRLVQQ